MDYAYWKRFNDKNYNILDAINLIKDNSDRKDFQLRNKQEGSWKEVKIDINEVKNIDDIQLPLWVSKSDKWEIWIPDYDMESKVDDIRDYFDSICEIDTRFWKLSKMDISQIFDEIDNHCLNDELRMEIIYWLRDNNKIKLRY